MAGLMSRFTTLFKVKANTMLDKAEDPGQTLDYSYQQQLEMLQKVKRGVADVVTAKKRLQLQTAKLEESVVKLDGQARQALAGNREDLARTALERKALIQGQLQGLDTQITAARAAAAEPDRPGAAAVGEGRVVPHPEGGREGAVLRGRGAGADRRGDDRPGRGDVGRRARAPARAGQDRADAGAGGGGERARRHGRHRRPDGGARARTSTPRSRPSRPGARSTPRWRSCARRSEAARRRRSSARAAPSRPSPRRSAK